MREDEDKLVEGMDNDNEKKETEGSEPVGIKENVENEKELEKSKINIGYGIQQPNNDNDDIEVTSLEIEENTKNIPDAEFFDVVSEMNGNLCESCGEAVSENQIYCPKCGKKVKEVPIYRKKKINIIVGVIGIILIIAFSVIFVNEKKQIEEEKRQQAIIEMQREDREQYIDDFENFTYKVIDAGANIEGITNTIQKYWYENIFEGKHGADIDEAILNAMSDQDDKIKKAQNLDEDILALYIRLKDVPKGSEDLDNYVDEIEDLYNVYSDYYNFAVSPSGNYAQYTSSNGDKNSAFVTKYKSLESILRSDSNFNNLEEKDL